MTNKIHVPRSDNGTVITEPSRVKYMMEIESKWNIRDGDSARLVVEDRVR